MSGIYTIQSGFALPRGNVIYNGNPKDIALPLNQRSPDHWFNVANFETAPAKQLLGNQLRTWALRYPTIRGPRQNNLDIALIKQTRITEGKNIEFRAEALNAANHPFFPNPNMTVTSAQKREGHRLWADQCIDHEQLCTPSADESAVGFLIILIIILS